MKWKMISNTEFESTTPEGYEIIVFKGSLGWAWAIQKEGITIDHAYKHSIPNGGELGAKHLAERYYLKLI